MVRITDNKEDIVALWSEAFGDSREDILYFVDNVRHADCIAVYDDDIKSMLYLVDCNVDDNKCKYVYAACTLKSAQSNGYMTMLLDYCAKEYGDICLIPANEGLIEYYDARGFNKVFDITDITFDEIDGIKEYLFEGCSLKDPIALYRQGE